MMATIKTSIESDTDQCTKLHTKMTYFQDNIKSLEDQSEAMSFIMYTKCIELATEAGTFLKDVKTHDEVKMTYTPDTTIEQTLTTLSGLGKFKCLSKFAHSPRKEDNEAVEIDYGTFYDIFDETEKNLNVNRLKSYKDYGARYCQMLAICETAEGNL
ncbi:hypothetical protein DPMN_163215 [Dreissena polymorpha]|uniref:Uncharacterized protein n=1 Tax=Dreissena polymorpha TaxID=45954 RepID=A0A9D4EW68_DREPO|nr:hypothetical protein DPMN_163215 [Dreissena polymorpha]